MEASWAGARSQMCFPRPKCAPRREKVESRIVKMVARSMSPT